MFGTRVAAYTCGHRTDESGSGDEHIFAEQRKSKCGVRGVAERIHDSCKIVGYRRVQFDHIGFRNGDILSKTTVLAHNADRDSVLAHMSHASAAVAAMTADNVSLGRDAFANLDIAHTGTDFGYFANELMSHRVRRSAMGLRPCVPLVHVEVSTANSGLFDLDKNVVDAYFRHRYIFHPDARFCISFY